MLAKKEDPSVPEIRHPQYSLLDMRKAEDPLWFVKIPNYIEDEIRRFQTPTQIGEIILEHCPDGTQKASMVIDNKIIQEIPVEMLPSRYIFRFDDEPNQYQYAFTHDRTTGIVRMMGHINANANVTPEPKELAKSAKIRKYKEEQAKKKNMKEKVVLTEVPTPTSTRKDDNVKRTYKKVVKDKRIKKDHDTLLRELIDAFTKKDSWRLADLSDALDQSQEYIRSELSNIARFSQQTQTWILKEEMKSSKE